MLELAMIHRPGILDGRLNLGRILETMLYYDRVHLMMNAETFAGLWDTLGPDDLGVLLGHHTITTTLTPQTLGIQSEVGTALTTHHPVAFKLSGREGKVIHDKDDVGTLVQMLERLPNRPGGTWAQVNKLLKLTKASRYAKMLGGEVASRQRLVSLARDQDTLKLFVRGWAIANGQLVNEQALQHAEISLIEFGERFAISSTVSLEQMVARWNPSETWATILASIQDYAVDLYLSNAHSADIVTAPEISEVASARVDLSLQRGAQNSAQISAFEEMVFGDAHGFADAINDGLISFSEALKVIDQSRRFRTWAKGLSPDASIISEYHRAITKDTVLQKLPFSTARFAFFNSVGMAADAAAPGAGLISSAIDTFIVERIAGGWRPNFFVRNMQKTLKKAQKRAIEGDY